MDNLNERIKNIATMLFKEARSAFINRQNLGDRISLLREHRENNTFPKAYNHMNIPSIQFLKDTPEEIINEYTDCLFEANINANKFRLEMEINVLVKCHAAVDAKFSALTTKEGAKIACTAKFANILNLPNVFDTAFDSFLVNWASFLDNRNVRLNNRNTRNERRAGTDKDQDKSSQQTTPGTSDNPNMDTGMDIPTQPQPADPDVHAIRLLLEQLSTRTDKLELINSTQPNQGMNRNNNANNNNTINNNNSNRRRHPSNNSRRLNSYNRSRSPSRSSHHSARSERGRGNTTSNVNRNARRTPRSPSATQQRQGRGRSQSRRPPRSSSSTNRRPQNRQQPRQHTNRPSRSMSGNRRGSGNQRNRRSYSPHRHRSPQHQHNRRTSRNN